MRSPSISTSPPRYSVVLMFEGEISATWFPFYRSVASMAVVRIPPMADAAIDGFALFPCFLFISFFRYLSSASHRGHVPGQSP